MEKFLYYFFIFFIYSVIGWIIESTYVAIKEKKFTNRGFLIGPYCPIYGFGSLTMILYLEQYKDNLITVFLLAIILCSTLEYLTSFFMEKLFHARWWDYSNEKFNLNGRICGKNALLFGLGGVFIIYIVHPIINKVILSINETLLLILIIIFFIVYITDTIISLKIVNKFKTTIRSIDIKKDSTQDFSKLVKEVLLNNHKILQKRLLSAFPNIELKKLANLKKDIKELLTK